jgi:predicted dehydrogenase
MLRAVVVGLGGWGQRLAQSVHEKSDKIRIVKGVTRTPQKVEAFSRATGIEVVSDLGAMLADPAVDAVILATPHSHHVAQVKAAAAAGKQVFVEKPLALERAEAESAFDACAETGVVLAIGQNRRFLPAVYHLRGLIASGKLGQLLHVEANFSGLSAERHATSTWRASRDESPWGGMTGKGLHMSDLMISFLGPIAAVDARSLCQVHRADLDDTTLMLLRFASGATGYLATLTTTPDEWRLQLFGSKGWAEIRDHDRLTTKLVGEEEAVLNFPPTDIERAELEAFADAVLTGRPYPVARDEALNNIAFLEAIGRSVAASGQVPV